jgi:hypothetical protein
MQTFLPYDDFTRSAVSLDTKRLGKQRVEAYQIMKAIADPDYGWQHHPAVQMWRGYEHALILYGITCCVAWLQRGYRDTLFVKFMDALLADGLPGSEVVAPPWLGDARFHDSHKSNLVRKDASHYGPQFPGVPDDLPYYWPTHHEANA